MLLILLSWIYIFMTTLIIGVSLKRLLRLDGLDIVVTLFLGFFGIVLFTGFWAIFLAVNETHQVILLLISCILLYDNKALIRNELMELKSSFTGLSLFFRCVFFVLLLLTLAQCASPSFVIDNESYYIQTIKWLNNHGFVKGLTNLHMFLGQTSGWHILQSAFNFNFIYHSFNDISGFCLLLGNFYAILRLNTYVKVSEKDNVDLIIGLFPLFNVFFFQFIAAPSADIAIYVISLLVFHHFIKCFLAYDRVTFVIVVILSIFAAFIKLTGLFLFVLPIVLYVKYYSKTRKTTSMLSIIGSLTLLLFIIKNIIITGNALYPLAGIKNLNASWSLPEAVTTYLENYSKASSFGLTYEAYENASKLELIKNWLSMPKLHGILNKSMILLSIIFPMVIWKFKSKKALFQIYGLSLLNLIILFSTSPQYRFFFPFLMFYVLVLASLFLRRKSLIMSTMIVILISTTIPLFHSMDNSNLTNTKYHEASSTFSLNYSIFPSKNTRFGKNFETISVGNLQLNAPTEIDFFWGTGDIPPPALNEQQLDYFSTYFNIIPQQRGEKLQEGFYSKKLLDE